MIRQALNYVLFTAFMLAAVLSPSAAAWAKSLTVGLGQSEIVPVGKDAADILVSNPEIIDAGSMRAGELHVTGLKMGATDIMVFDDGGKLLRKIDIEVSADTKAIQEQIDKAFPAAKVKVDAVDNQIVLKGTVPNADVANKVRDLVTHAIPKDGTINNLLTTSDGQQVMIKVKVVEVARTVLNELGIESNVTSPTGGNFSGSSLATTASMGLTVDPSFGVGSLIYNTGSTGPLEIIMRALERDGLVNTLAQPNLTAISGENARFLAGGEFPIPSQRDQNGNIQYEYKPFGVSLSFKPVVLDHNRINLQIATEVSEISNELTLQLPGITVPSFTVRRADTTVELPSGGSLMIAGLIQSKAVGRMNKLPGIKDVPVLGQLVSSESFSRNESEMLVLITAYTVKPFADNQATREPEPNKPARSPLNLALVERLAAAYGNDVVAAVKGDKPFGYITE